jgi:hypothetical protein
MTTSLSSGTRFESDVVSLLDITLGFSDTYGDTGVTALAARAAREVGAVPSHRSPYHFPYPGFEWMAPLARAMDVCALPRQRMVLATDPVLIRQTAELIARDLGAVDVAADVKLAFNGRISTQFTDPHVVITGTKGAGTVDGFITASPSG